MDSSTVAFAAVTMIGTILGLVVTPLFNLLNKNTKALDKMGKAMDKVAKETAKGSREAKQRNGHLGEQNVQIAELVARVLTTLQNSANTLAKDEKNKATAVREVKADLIQ